VSEHQFTSAFEQLPRPARQPWVWHPCVRSFPHPPPAPTYKAIKEKCWLFIYLLNHQIFFLFYFFYYQQFYMFTHVFQSIQVLSRN